MALLKLTLDTNALINLFDFNSSTATSVDELSAIMRHALEGRVNLCITTVVSRDLERDGPGDRRVEMLRKIRMFPEVGIVPAPFRLDASRWDSGDVFASMEDQELAERVRKIVAPMLSPEDLNYEREIADVDHLVAHKRADRDLFVTDDKHDILRRRQALEHECGICVVTPAAALDRIERTVDLALVAEDFRAIFLDLIKLLEGRLQAESWAEGDEADYAACRAFLLRTFPKLLPHYTAYLQNIRGHWGPPNNPFRPFYEEETGAAAVVALRNETVGSVRWAAFHEWPIELAKRIGRLRTVLEEFVGYIEAAKR